MLKLLRWLLTGRWEPAVEPESSLAVKVATLEVELHGLQTEWADVLDKIPRWTARENAQKRRAVAAKLAADEGQEPGPGEIVDPGAAQAAGMSRKGYLRQLAHQNGGRR